MNVEIKMSYDEIKYIQHLIHVTRTVLITMRKKDQIFVFSIVLDIGQKVERKATTLDDAFGSNSRKRYKMKFKYHEAVILEKFLLDTLKNETDAYNRNLALFITGKLNQKLA